MPADLQSAGQPLAGRTLVIPTVDALRAAVRAARAAGRRIGLVPTMGALHEGHLSLVRESLASGAYTVTTIFVNPTQFGPGEDFARYPRTLEADVRMLASLGADLVFAPAAEAMYPEGCSTFVDPPRVASRWEGECRPAHFRGVATIVLKLFLQALADVAWFGQKDYQQVQVIRHMVRELDVPVEIRVCPTVREPDGLAMSSRNRYLSAAERQQAIAVPRSLEAAAEQFSQGQRDAQRLIAAIRDVLDRGGITAIDYVTVADAESLEPLEVVRGPAVALIAARLGATRLIDNRLLEASAPR